VIKQAEILVTEGGGYKLIMILWLSSLYGGQWGLLGIMLFRAHMRVCSMSVRADAETLRQIPIFAECEPMHLQLLALPPSDSFFSGEAIISQGKKTKSAFLLLSGNLTFSNFQVRKPIHCQAEPGALLGRSR
jgi:hypothetical protein